MSIHDRRFLSGIPVREISGISLCSQIVKFSLKNSDITTISYYTCGLSKIIPYELFFSVKIHDKAISLSSRTLMHHISTGKMDMESSRHLPFISLVNHIVKMVFQDKENSFKSFSTEAEKSNSTNPSHSIDDMSEIHEKLLLQPMAIESQYNVQQFTHCIFFRHYSHIPEEYLRPKYPFLVIILLNSIECEHTKSFGPCEFLMHLAKETAYFPIPFWNDMNRSLIPLDKRLFKYSNILHLENTKNFQKSMITYVTLSLQEKPTILIEFELLNLKLKMNDMAHLDCVRFKCLLRPTVDAYLVRDIPGQEDIKVHAVQNKCQSFGFANLILCLSPDDYKTESGNLSSTDPNHNPILHVQIDASMLIVKICSKRVWIELLDNISKGHNYKRNDALFNLEVRFNNQHIVKYHYPNEDTYIHYQVPFERPAFNGIYYVSHFFVVHKEGDEYVDPIALRKRLPIDKLARFLKTFELFVAEYVSRQKTALRACTLFSFKLLITIPSNQCKVVCKDVTPALEIGQSHDRTLIAGLCNELSKKLSSRHSNIDIVLNEPELNFVIALTNRR